MTEFQTIPAIPKTAWLLTDPAAPAQSASLFELGRFPLQFPVNCHPSCRKSSRKCRKQGHGDINVMHSTARARIDYGGLDCLAGSRVVNADLRPTLGIVVWVAPVCHHREGEGDDGVSVGARDTTGSETGGEIGQVAAIGSGQAG